MKYARIINLSFLQNFLVELAKGATDTSKIIPGQLFWCRNLNLYVSEKVVILGWEKYDLWGLGASHSVL